MARHNVKVLKYDLQPEQQAGCNCPVPANCPVQGNCRIKCVVYEANVVETVSGKSETYTGLTYRTFKESSTRTTPIRGSQKIY